MIDLDKINELIGKPYDKVNFHCWSLVEELLPNAPKIEYIQRDLFDSTKKIKETLKDRQTFYEYVEIPKNSDIILLGKGKNFIHVGVFYENSIIHNDICGVRIETIKNISKKYKNIKYIRLINNDNIS